MLVTFAELRVAPEPVIGRPDKDLRPTVVAQLTQGDAQAAGGHERQLMTRAEPASVDRTRPLQSLYKE